MVEKGKEVIKAEKNKWLDRIAGARESSAEAVGVDARKIKDLTKLRLWEDGCGSAGRGRSAKTTGWIHWEKSESEEAFRLLLVGRQGV